MESTVKHIIPNVSYFRLEAHELLIKDKIRCEKYREAIKNVVIKGNIVLDFGAGSGILSFFAHQAGAMKIYAIEKEQIINIANKIYDINKYNNIIFKETNSNDLVLNESIDVLISEPIGSFGLNTFNIHDYLHLRDKYLKKEGKIIPELLSLYICPINSIQLNKELEFWNNPLYGIDFSPVTQYARNQVYNISTNDCKYLSAPQKIFQLNFKNDEINNISTHNNFSISECDELVGICGWFDLNLTNDIVIHTSPLDETTSWYQTFFPLYKQILVQPNDNLIIHISNEFKYPQIIWKWEVELFRKETKIMEESHNSVESFPQKPDDLPISYYIVF